MSDSFNLTTVIAIIALVLGIINLCIFVCRYRRDYQERIEVRAGNPKTTKTIENGIIKVTIIETLPYVNIINLSYIPITLSHFGITIRSDFGKGKPFVAERVEISPPISIKPRANKKFTSPSMLDLITKWESKQIKNTGNGVELPDNSLYFFVETSTGFSDECLFF